MSLKDKIDGQLKESIKAKDEIKVSVLRQIKTKVKNTEIQKGKELSDTEIEEVVFSLVKSHNESIESFKKGGRDDLIAREEQELDVLKTYLPEQLSYNDLKKIVEETVKEAGASGPQDMGKVMGKIMPKVKGKADGSKINALVKDILSKG